MLKVGDTIYKFDENHRVYRRNADGRATGGPIYSEYFRPHIIAGETKLSWLSGPRGEDKINKKTMKEAGRGSHGYQWHTKASMEDHLWSAIHRHEIIQRVQQASIDELKQIAALVGYSSRAKNSEA